MTRTATGLVCSLVAACVLVAADEPKLQRPDVASAERVYGQGEAYQTLFEKVGRSGLSDLTKDKDTSIALQASWELHKKLVKRAFKLKSYHPDHTYDAAEMKKFLAFLKERTKAPVPDWWADAITDLSVGKGEFSGYERVDPERKELEEIKVGGLVRRVKKGVELTISDETYTYKSNGVTLEVPRPKTVEDGVLFGDCMTDASGGGITCLAVYSSVFARVFKVAGFESKTGKRLWDVKVWALAKSDHAGPSAGHRAELTVKGKTVFVFGEEVCGLYLEAFDLGMGKCQFRFCTSYWGRYSEGWNLKPAD